MKKKDRIDTVRFFRDCLIENNEISGKLFDFLVDDIMSDEDIVNSFGDMDSVYFNTMVIKTDKFCKITVEKFFPSSVPVDTTIYCYDGEDKKVTVFFEKDDSYCFREYDVDEGYALSQIVSGELLSDGEQLGESEKKLINEIMGNTDCLQYALENGYSCDVLNLSLGSSEMYRKTGESFIYTCGLLASQEDASVTIIASNNRVNMYFSDGLSSSGNALIDMDEFAQANPDFDCAYLIQKIDILEKNGYDTTNIPDSLKVKRKKLRKKVEEN